MANAHHKRGRTPRWQRATALLPLVLLSGAWSANAVAEHDEKSVGITAPGVPEVPVDVFDQPGSVALPDASSPDDRPSVRSSADAERASLGSVNGIPAAALGAYKRAAAILNQADPACNLDWPLIAAIGRVESDHGRSNGNTLNEQGRARPGIYGPPLNGENGTARILDSDGGVLDNDSVYDRAVGPMQFIPSTWRAAGVDADRDGTKDPQDIDDAAAATAVYLCAGSEDLSTPGGQRTAVHRYNQNDNYVDVVLSLAEAYADGDYAAVPNGTPSSPLLRAHEQAGDANSQSQQAKSSNGSQGKQTTTVSSGQSGNTSSVSGSGGPGKNGSGTSGPGKGSSGEGGGNDKSGGSGQSPGKEQDDRTEQAGDKAKKAVDDVTKPARKTVVGTAKAATLCTNELSGTLQDGALDEAVDACADEITGKTLGQATDFLEQSPKSLLNTLGLGNLLGGLLGG